MLIFEKMPENCVINQNENNLILYEIFDMKERKSDYECIGYITKLRKNNKVVYTSLNLFEGCKDIINLSTEQMSAICNFIETVKGSDESILIRKLKNKLSKNIEKIEKYEKQKNTKMSEMLNHKNDEILDLT